METQAQWALGWVSALDPGPIAERLDACMTPSEDACFCVNPMLLLRGWFLMPRSGKGFFRSARNRQPPAPAVTPCCGSGLDNLDWKTAGPLIAFCKAGLSSTTTCAIGRRHTRLARERFCRS